MLSAFAFIGNLLDRTRLSFDEKDRFKDLKSKYNNSLGGIGVGFLGLVVTFVAGIGVWYFATHPAPSRFYLPVKTEALSQVTGQTSQTSSNMTMKEVQSSRSPRMSNARMQSWVTRALIDSYTFDFTTYEKVLSDVSVVYRKDTYQQFLQQMNKSKGVVPTVKSNSLIVSLTPTSEVRIIQQGMNNGRRIWSVEMKAAIYYSGALQQTPPPSNVMFKMLIQEVDPTINPYGLVIAQISQGVG